MLYLEHGPSLYRSEREKAQILHVTTDKLII